MRGAAEAETLAPQVFKGLPPRARGCRTRGLVGPVRRRSTPARARGCRAGTCSGARSAWRRTAARTRRRAAGTARRRGAGRAADRFVPRVEGRPAGGPDGRARDGRADEDGVEREYDALVDDLTARETAADDRRRAANVREARPGARPPAGARRAGRTMRARRSARGLDYPGTATNHRRHGDEVHVLDTRQTAAAMQRAIDLHLAWPRVPDEARVLHARTTAVVLGPDLDDSTDALLCWTQRHPRRSTSTCAGLLSRLPRMHRSRGVYPTCTGRPIPGLIFVFIAVYPRVRGAAPPAPRRPETSHGLSPRARGGPPGRRRPRAGARSIPACAGLP